MQRERVSLYLALASGELLGGGQPLGSASSEAMRRESRKDARPSARDRGRGGQARRSCEVGPLPVEHTSAAPLAQARRQTEETLADPLVQAAVEIFGAGSAAIRERRGP